MKTQTLKLGTHRKNKRVWLDNAAMLNEAGVKPGILYNAFYRPITQSIELVLHPEGCRKVSKKTKAAPYEREDVPVIDLNSTKVGWALGKVDRIVVEYETGLISIRGKA